MNRVDGKVALVTGGGGLIGRGISLILAQAGAKVVVAGRNQTPVEETVQLITDAGGEAIAVTLDITSEESWQQAIDQTLTRFKKLNILVNNAGGGWLKSGCQDVSLEDWRYAIDVNLEGTFLGIRSAIAVMKNNQEPNSIINIASISAIMPDLRVPYSVAKAGVLMLAKGAAMECRRKGQDNIRVNSVLPGGVIGDEIDEPKGPEEFERYFPPSRFGRAKDIALAVLFLASEDSAYINGGELVVDDGYSASVGGFLTANSSEVLSEHYRVLAEQEG